jgi:hypothetical protein
MRNAIVGSISHGTMKTEDLISRFCDEIAYQDGAPSSLTLACLWWQDETPAEEDEEDHQERGDFLVERLVDDLNRRAPAYCYFGAHEGDGADYGYWLSSEALEEAIEQSEPGDESGEYVNVDDGVRIVVSDHGNVSVYNLSDGTEVLSIV